MKLNINGNTVDLDIEAFNKALEDKQESFDIKSEDLVIRSSESQALYEDNLKKEVGTHQHEISRKEILKGLGIDIEGKGVHNTLDKSLGAINEFIGDSTKNALAEAGEAPDGKIKELTTDLETLRSSLAAKDSEIESKTNEFLTFKNEISITNSLSKALSTFDDINEPEDQALIFKTKQKIALDENGIPRGLNLDGTIMKDSNLNPLDLKQVATAYYDKNPQYLKPVSGGAGGSDSNGEGGKIKFDEFVKQQHQLGNTPASVEFKAEAARLNKEGALDLS